MKGNDISFYGELTEYILELSVNTHFTELLGKYNFNITSQSCR